MSKNKYFNFWMESPNIDDDEREIMLNMSEHDIHNSFNEKPIAFGTAGYRAKVGPGLLYLNEQTYKQLTIAYGKLILDKNPNKKPTIFVAHDNRLDGLKYSNIIAATLSNLGINVVLHKDNLPIPTPMVSYIVRNQRFDGAINITASHNPKEYNGFKVFDNTGSQLSNKDIEDLSYYLPKWDINLSYVIKRNKKNISFLSERVINSYFNDVNKHININALEKDNEPIIFVSHHGTASLNKVVDFLRSKGHNIVPVYSQSYLNEEFENSTCINPEEDKSFNEAIKLADKLQSNVIIGLDPDGDRLAIVIRHEGKWIFLNGNENGIIATYYLLKYKDYGNKVPTVISTYVSNNLINKIVKKYDGLVLRSAVGFKNIATLMNSISNDERTSFVVAFEEAVGLCISDSIREKDGIAAALLMVEIYKFYKQKGFTLVDVLKKLIYEEFGNWIGKTNSFKISGDDWKEKVDGIMDEILNSDISKINQFNVSNIVWNDIAKCIEIYFDDNQSWIKFRASGTEPKFKIYYNLYFNDSSFTYTRSYNQKINELMKINNFLIRKFNIK